jgi:hypothetical protein
VTVAVFALFADTVAPTTTVAAAPTDTVWVTLETVGTVVAAEAGATDSRPSPSPETATSAMRLRVVFVDIYFLSEKVEAKNFLASAGAEVAYSCVMSALSCSP